MLAGRILFIMCSIVAEVSSEAAQCILVTALGHLWTLCCLVAMPGDAGMRGDCQRDGGRQPAGSVAPVRYQV
jgi:hypothetical protein